MALAIAGHLYVPRTIQYFENKRNTEHLIVTNNTRRGCIQLAYGALFFIERAKGAYKNGARGSLLHGFNGATCTSDQPARVTQPTNILSHTVFFDTQPKRTI